MNAHIRKHAPWAKEVSGEIHWSSAVIFAKRLAESFGRGKIWLAGDSAHIVPPTGAKGLNMAVGDVQTMTRALRAFYEDGNSELIETYSDVSLKRVWQVQRFASMLCYNLHRFPEHNTFEHKMQIAELNNMTHSKEAMRTLAQNYTGVPVEVFYDLD